MSARTASLACSARSLAPSRSTRTITARSRSLSSLPCSSTAAALLASTFDASADRLSAVSRWRPSSPRSASTIASFAAICRSCKSISPCTSFRQRSSTAFTFASASERARASASSFATCSVWERRSAGRGGQTLLNKSREMPQHKG